jgi:hypothetical protein
MLDVIPARPQRHGPLTIFPLIASSAPRLPYRLMADALTSGALKIGEVGTGTVPELLATNSGEEAVLILDGEQLVGARQNRTTNRSLILPPRSETRIPVSCMEQGRWHHTGEDFRPAPQCSPSSVRRHARDKEVQYVKAQGSAPVSALADVQGEVWSSISAFSSGLRSRSATGALDEVVEARSTDIGAWVRDFPLESRQIGMLAFLGARPLGLDVIGCTRLYERVHERLVRGYVVDALSSRSQPRRMSVELAQAFLDRVNSAQRLPSPTVGLGEYWVLSDRVVGGELSTGKALVHLVAFPALRGQRNPPEEPRPIYDPLPPPSIRRRRFE